jgi:hypothetical protein
MLGAAPAPPGSGGDGGFVMAAPGGVQFSGRARVGNGGFAVIYGPLVNAGDLTGAVPILHRWADWECIAPEALFLYGGCGGGGGGGDGQIIPAGARPRAKRKR